MNILFLSLYSFDSINDGYICADLVRYFRDEGHNLVVMTPFENASKTIKNSNEGIAHYKIACGQIQKTSSIKKIINLRKLDNASKKILAKDFKNNKFELIIAMISHCAFFKTVRYIKHKDNAFLYNLVKDIFPQNAVDLGMMKKNGLIYKWFKHRENKYYEISDCLGVISPKSAEFLQKENKRLKKVCIEVNPNSISPREMIISENEKNEIKGKYAIPQDKLLYIYGGNFGKPQGIDFILDIIKSNEIFESKIFYFIVGNGTEFKKMQTFFINNNIKNAKIEDRIPQDDFRKLNYSADAGLVFLNPKFTVPNYPSRILSYMEAKLPILFAVDKACDAGEIAEKNEYGLTCLSGDLQKFNQNALALASNEELRKSMGQKAYEYLLNNYTVKHSYDIIMKHFGDTNV